MEIMLNGEKLKVLFLEVGMDYGYIFFFVLFNNVFEVIGRIIRWEKYIN